MTNTAGPHFILSGARFDTSPSVQGMQAFYWTSSAWTSATAAYGLRLFGTDSRVVPADGYYKRHGFPLRCLAKNQNKR